MVAVDAARRGADRSEIVAALSQRDGKSIAQALADLTEDEAGEVRRRFLSFGTCSISDPLTELEGLGLIVRFRQNRRNSRMTVTTIDIPADSLFGLDNLPYGVFSPAGGLPRVGVRVAESVVDLAATLGDSVFSEPTLNAFMAQGRDQWVSVRNRDHGARD